MTRGDQDGAAPIAAPPTPLTSFFGRSAEMANLSALLNDHRLVTVTGPGGCGKTRLAIEFLLRRAEHPAPGSAAVAFVELAAIFNGADVATAVLAGCNIRDDPGASALDRLQVAWHSRAGLLVLDNCEQVRLDVAALVAALLHACPALRVLVTTRIPLGLTGEAVMTISGLTAANEAVDLFLDRVERVQPGLADDARARKTAAEICRLTDSLPLGIEIAAAHARSLTLKQIQDGVAGRPGRASLDPVTLPQHASLAACISWSLSLIGEAERHALTSLSVFEGRFTLAAALEMIGSPAAEAGGLAVLAQLVDCSLVQFDARDGRYLLLDTVRKFAADESAAAELHGAHQRLLGWAAGFAASQRDALARGDLEALERVTRDEPGVLAAIRYAVREDHGREPAGEIVADLAFAWSLRGRCLQGRELAERLSAVVTRPSCRLAWATAFLALYSGEVEKGAMLAVDAAALAAKAQDAATQGRALTLVGLAQGFVDPTGAAQVLIAAAELAERAGDAWCLVETLQVLAYSCLYQADHDGALKWADRAMLTVEALGHDQLRAWDEVVRAEVASLRGDFEAATRHARKALNLAQTFGEPVSAIGALQALVRALSQLGRAVEATHIVDGARAFFAAQPGLGSAAGLDLAASMAACWDDPLRGRDLIAGVQESIARRSAPVLDGPAQLLLAYSEHAAGNAEAAVVAAKDALRSGVQLGNRELQGAANLVLAAVERPSPQALERAHGVLADAMSLGLPILAVDAIDVIAGSALDRGNPLAAARLHAASGQIRDDLGVVCSPLVRQFRPRDEMQLARLSAEHELADARAAGRRLDLPQAASYAARSRGRRARPKSGWSSLTPTEREVVSLAARGLTNSAIGQQMLIAPGTVRTHLRSIFGKLAVSNRAELAGIAVRRETPTEPAFNSLADPR